MGVPNFLPSLLEPHSAGRPFDIRQWSPNDNAENENDNDTSSNNHDTSESSESHSRKLRVAIDVSTWVYKACQGFGDILADDRFLDNFGRRQLQQEQQQNQQQEQPQTHDKRSTSIQPSTEQIQQFTQKCVSFVTSRLQDWQAHADILVVLDGRSPPAKIATVTERRAQRQADQTARDSSHTTTTDRIQANKRAGAGTEYPHVMDALVVQLRSLGIPLLNAPYEADGQLAYLSEQGLVDIVVTEDSDLLPCGATAVLYKVLDKQWPPYFQNHSLLAAHHYDDHAHKRHKRAMSTTTHPQSNQEPTTQHSSSYSSIYEGLLIRQEDWGACRTHNLQDISPALLALVFCLAGCDYCASLPGIGIGKALAIVRQVYCDITGKNTQTPPLRRVLDQVYQSSWQKAQELTPAFRQTYEENLVAALVSFRHGIVWDPFSGECMFRNRDTPDPEFVSYPPYRRLVEAKDSLQTIVGTLIPSPTCQYIAEGWLEARTERPRTAGKGQPYLALPRHVQDFVNRRKKTTEGSNPELLSQEQQQQQEDEEQDDDDDTDSRTTTAQTPMSVSHRNEMSTPHSSSQSTTTGLASQLPSSLSQSTGASSQPLLSGGDSPREASQSSTMPESQEENVIHMDDVDDDDLLETQQPETQDPMG